MTDDTLSQIHAQNIDSDSLFRSAVFAVCLNKSNRSNESKQTNMTDDTLSQIHAQNIDSDSLFRSAVVAVFHGRCGTGRRFD